MIYLDHAAATPHNPEVLKLGRLVEPAFGNPSSIHRVGRKSRDLMDQSRYQSANVLECKIGEIIFTSGGTEAVFLGIVGSWLRNKKTIYTSPLVHACVWGALDFLEQHFEVTVKTLPLDAQGFIDVENIDDEILSEAGLIISEHGNSETGHLQPVAKMGKKIQKHKTDSGSNFPLFLVDSAASIVTEKTTLEYTKSDMFIVSGEKFGGLGGSGVLVRKESVNLAPIVPGSQEFGYRAGTENLPGIVTLGAALNVHDKTQEIQRLEFLELNRFIRNLFKENFPRIEITTPEANFLPHVFHFILPESYKGNAHMFVTQCDLEGVCISAGPACSSGSHEGSRVLKNLGCKPAESERGVRLSFGLQTTKEELTKAFKLFEKILCV